MKEHTPFFKMQTKDVHGWNLTNLLNVCHRMCFSVLVPVSKALFMAKLLS